MKITTLIEDTAYRSQLLAEHGVAMLIEVDGKSILFDTGQSGYALVKNAANLGIDLGAIDSLVLSHGHYDHTGGIRALAELTDSLETYAHPSIFDNKWAKSKKAERYIGIPASDQAIRGWGLNLHVSNEPVRISESVMTTGEIPRVTDFESIESRLCLRAGDGKDGRLVQDPLMDDLSIVVRCGGGGLVLVLGCAHSGLINILHHVRKMYGNETIELVIGGTHLVNADRMRIQKTIDALQDFDVKKVAASHCTGEKAVVMFYEALGDRMVSNHVGDVFEL